MKKIVKAAALLIAAMAAMGLVSCADNDAEDLGILLIVKDYQEKKEAEAAVAAAAAKKAAEEDSTPVTVDAKWDFDTGTNASTNETLAALDGATALSADLVITADSGSGATFTLLPTKDKDNVGLNKPKYGNTKTDKNTKKTTYKAGGGIAQNTTSNAFEFASVKVDGACTITVVARAGGSYNASKSRTFYFEGAESSGYTMTSDEKQVTAADGGTAWGDHTVTYTASAAGTYKIFANGMKFLSVTCSQ